MTEKSYKLVYYDIKGLVEPIRWMFRIANTPFEDVRIPLNNWTEKKNRSPDQLPVLYIGDEETKLSQANPIMRFVANEFGFNGSSEVESTRADEIVEILYEFRLCVASQKQFFTSQTPDIARHTVFRDIQQEKNLSKKVLMKKTLVTGYFPKYLDKIERCLRESGGPFLAGSSLTYADLAFANFMDICETNINPDLLNNYPALQTIVEEVFEIPEIKEWVENSTADIKIPEDATPGA